MRTPAGARHGRGRQHVQRHVVGTQRLFPTGVGRGMAGGRCSTASTPSKWRVHAPSGSSRSAATSVRRSRSSGPNRVSSACRSMPTGVRTRRRARMARALRPIWPVAPVTTMRAGKGCSHVEGFRFRAAGAQADGRAQREGRAGAFGHAGDGVDAQCADEMVVLRGDQQEGAVGREGDVARRAPAGGEVAQRLQPGRIASQAEGGDAVVAAVGDHQQPAVRVQPERRGPTGAGPAGRQRAGVRQLAGGFAHPRPARRR